MIIYIRWQSLSIAFDGMPSSASNSKSVLNTVFDVMSSYTSDGNVFT